MVHNVGYDNSCGHASMRLTTDQTNNAGRLRTVTHMYGAIMVPQTGIFHLFAWCDSSAYFFCSILFFFVLANNDVINGYQSEGGLIIDPSIYSTYYYVFKFQYESPISIRGNYL